MVTIIGSILMIIGMLFLFISFLIPDKKGMYLFITGFILSMIGYIIFPKTNPEPIELKSKKEINSDSIYLKGYKDGINDCKNK